MKQTKVIVTLLAAGYVADKQWRREASDTTTQFRLNHADGSYYIVTEHRGSGIVKSWFYRGLGGDAKSDKWFDSFPDEPTTQLVDHVRRNKKKTPRTVRSRRSTEEVRRANFVMYD